ncbi:MAG: hypothetical protein AB8B58_10705 [Roseobacter sp.]
MRFMQFYTARFLGTLVFGLSVSILLLSASLQSDVIRLSVLAVLGAPLVVSAFVEGLWFRGPHPPNAKSCIQTGLWMTASVGAIFSMPMSMAINPEAHALAATLYMAFMLAVCWLLLFSGYVFGVIMEMEQRRN